jgi:Ankyrin repeat
MSMSVLTRAFFARNGNLWDELMTGEAKGRLLKLMEEEDGTTGPENLLSRSLYDGCIASYSGFNIYWYAARIPFVAEHLFSRVNEYDEGGYTPLMRAVEWGHLQVIKILLQRVPLDVDIDASAKHDASITAAECAMIKTCSNERNTLNQKIVEKCEWHALIYRPSVAKIMELIAVDHLIQPLASLILSFVFPKHEYRCKSASEKAEMFLIIHNNLVNLNQKWMLD